MLRILATALFALFVFLSPAMAQQAITIASCGTLPTTLDVGGAHVVYQDKNGVQCGSSLSWNGTTWDPMSGLLVGTVGAPATDVVTVQSPITLGSAGYPAASTPIGGNASGTTGAVVGTLAANATKTTYICGFNVQAVGGTAAVGPITIAGLITASQVYQASATAAGGTVASGTFIPCIPASAINTAITITTTADGTATAVNVNSWGFQQ
jgi:hypothetical protein